MSHAEASHPFTPVAHAADLADKGRMVVEVEDRLLVLVRVGDEFFALDDVCTHDDGPLSDGTVEDHTIACPRHGAKFDVRTGAALTMPATRPTQAHDVEVRDGQVYVRLRTTPKPLGLPIAQGAPKPSGEGVATECCGGTSAAHAAGHSNEGLAAAGGAGAACESAPGTDSAASGATGEPQGISEDSVREALKAVIDPELFVNIVDLGLIYNVAIDEQTDGKKHVAIDMTMTSPACPAGPQLIQNSKDVLGRIEGVSGVEVKLVMIPPWTPDRMTEAARDQLGIF
jgi:metal-sulfur cluster biosynthetic enzyme/nitrite reductase/ring-hydroxylating ferredoxin subunit